jgi:hypothetical protein
MLASANTACLEQQAISSMTMDLVRSKLRLRDIRDHRHEMFTALFECPSSKNMKRIAGLERYKRAAWAEQKRALKCLLRETCYPYDR